MIAGIGQLGPPELRRARVALALFIVGLVISGVTAFPLVPEVELLCRTFGVDDPGSSWPATLRDWLVTVREGLRATSARYPFLFYGTDWLAFGHLVIASALGMLGGWLGARAVARAKNAGATGRPTP